MTIADIAAALIASGYTTLDAQARALGLNRATTWTIMKAKHKMDRLQTRTLVAMLGNQDLPLMVREVVWLYIREHRKDWTG